MDIKTINIIAKEWSDKENGTTYFSSKIIINFGLKDAKVYFIPFKYGYEEAYIYESFDLLKKRGYLPYYNGADSGYWGYCRDTNIILSTQIEKVCKLEDLEF